MTPDELRAIAASLRQQAKYADSRSARMQDLDRAADYDRQARVQESAGVVAPVFDPEHDPGEAEFYEKLRVTRAFEDAGRSARIRAAMRQMETYLGLPHKE